VGRLEEGPATVVKLAVSLAVYIASIVAANVMTAHFGLVGVGFGLMVTAGTFAAGFALTARDFVNRYGGTRWALVGIAVGIVLSAVLASPALAVASAVAFGAAELVDFAVYRRLVPRNGFVAAVILSNLVSAPIDTVVFLAIAGFPITWQTVVGQLIAKIVWATLVPLGLYLVGRRVVRQGEPDAVLR
jgi:uncharacterized PurR-regulated membrane protein YhhQ (DUF165 family)